MGAVDDARGTKVAIMKLRSDLVSVRRQRDEAWATIKQALAGLGFDPSTYPSHAEMMDRIQALRWVEEQFWALAKERSTE